MLFRKVTTGERFSSMVASFMDSVSSGICLSRISTRCWTTFVGDCSGNSCDGVDSRLRLRQQWTAFV